MKKFDRKALLSMLFAGLVVLMSSSDAEAGIQPQLQLKDLGNKVKATVGVKIQVGFVNFNTHLGTFYVSKGSQLVRQFNRNGAQILMQLKARHNDVVELIIRVQVASHKSKMKIIRNL